jgi:DNA-binding NtrC family response regulator
MSGAGLKLLAPLPAPEARGVPPHHPTQSPALDRLLERIEQVSTPAGGRTAHARRVGAGVRRPDGYSPTMKTLYGSTLDSEADGSEPRERPGLVLLWARDEPGRCGEVLLPEEGEITIIGRGAPGWRLMRPGEAPAAHALASQRISRHQLQVEVKDDDSLLVKSLGQAGMTVNGRPYGQATVTPGDLIEVERRLLLLVVRRMTPMPGDARDAAHTFGEPDASGFVGESPAAWQARERASFAGRRNTHVLILGESGSGKELIARAVHRHSRRSGARLIARNAATIPEGLVDAELFGNIRNYPNTGTPERPGLIGQADGGALFLDEIGEMPQEVQAHLLRVLDSGEYQRLGDARPRTADLRLIAATNRDPDSLKHDLAARLRLRIQLPGLNERREDIPMLARHLLKRLAADDRELAQLFFEGGEPLLSLDLVRALVSYDYTTHVRELEGLLWSAIDFSGSGTLHAPPALRPPEEADPGELTAARVKAALEEAEGVKSRAAEILGLRDRYQLRRLMKKLGVE